MWWTRDHSASRRKAPGVSLVEFIEDALELRRSAFRTNGRDDDDVAVRRNLELRLVVDAGRLEYGSLGAPKRSCCRCGSTFSTWYGRDTASVRTAQADPCIFGFMSSLSGVRVLDLTRLLPGPMATLVLADLGASVDKLEDPYGAGDYARHGRAHLRRCEPDVPHIEPRKAEASCSIWKRPEGVAAFKRLVLHYDVLVEQFRPGVLDRLGDRTRRFARTPSEARQRAQVDGFTGSTGPLRHRAGHDLNYLARGAGILGMQGPEGGVPQMPGFQLADVGGGLWSVIAILSALYERDRTGRGAVLDIAMSDSVVPFATATFARLFSGETPGAGTELLTGGISPYNVYRTKDREHVTLGALEPKFLERFCGGTGSRSI